MNWKAVSSQLFARGVLLAVAVFCYWLLRDTRFSKITAGDAEGLNTLILLLGSIYAVMYAFVIYVIWDQFTDVEKFVMRECHSRPRFAALDEASATAGSAKGSCSRQRLWQATSPPGEPLPWIQWRRLRQSKAAHLHRSAGFFSRYLSWQFLHAVVITSATSVILS